MAKLTLDEAVDIRTDYLSNLSIAQISEKYKISRDKVLKVLNSEDETAKRLAEENIQLKFNKQTEAIQQLTEQGLQFLKDAITHASNSEQPHLFLDKVSSAIEKMDRIARLNLNRATEIKDTRSTITRLDVAETIKALDTPEKRADFLRNQLKINARNKTNSGTDTETITG
jgi:hypothetical protein